MNRTLTASYFLLLACAAGEQPLAIQHFLAHAAENHGEFGQKAAAFLVEHMPEADRASLTVSFLSENLALALRAREEFPWAKAVPGDIFLNDVLPYASLNETRESWRADFYEKAKLLTAECKTASEATQAINRDLFNLINVHYNTGRKRPNQSPQESIAQGRATCTGLAIILVDACRAVGIPARVVGTPLWTNKRGNHTWVEVWDGEWKFTGADEYDAKGLNCGWFVGDASKAVSDPPEHAIYATSWRSTGRHFPMVWNRRSTAVPAVDVTARYAVTTQAAKPDGAEVHLRVTDKPGGERIVVEAELLGADGAALAKVTTKAGQADRNDMPSLALQPGQDYTLRLTYAGEQRSLPLKAEKAGESTRDLDWASLAPKPRLDPMLYVEAWLKLPSAKRPAAPRIVLTKEQAGTVRGLLWEARRKELAEERHAEMEAKAIVIGDKTLKFEERVFGRRPRNRRLWISMHGGGNAPAQVNDRQWQNQIGLYEPREGIYLAPRAPTNTWNLWHEGHIDALFDRLIENCVALRGVNPDRVYLLGYSAGGDGVYQLAPRFADRLAAASMMAGHPNDASPLGLRNLPFAIFMGGKDAAYKRNEVAAEWGQKLADLQKADPQGYAHKVTIYEGLGHWMQRKDAEALPWMAEQTRNLWPKKVVWRQSSRLHERFYWLAMPKDLAAKDQTITAEVDGQNIRVTAEGTTQVELRLSDELLDLDQPIKVELNGQPTFEGKVERTLQALANTLAERPGERAAASAVLVVGK